MDIVVSLEASDEIRIKMSEDNSKIVEVSYVGCRRLLDSMQNMRLNHGDDISQWPLPSGVDHVSLLLKELILKTQNKWDFPYKEDELCHCRNVMTTSVDAAVLLGAHTPEEVSRLTSASTSCGTCRSDVEKVIKYRLS